MVMAKERIYGLVRDLPFFDSFDDDEIRDFSKNLSLRQVREGEVLFREGDVGDYLFFIVEGVIEIMLENENRQHKVIATYTTGASVGEMSLIDEYERSATVRAGSNCEILVLTKTKLDKIISENPVIGIKILKGLAKNISERLRTQVGRYRDLI